MTSGGAAASVPPASRPEPGTAGEPWLTQFLIVLAIAGACVMAAHLARPMVTYRAITLGATPVGIGLVQSAFSVLPLFTAFALGRAADRIGEVPIMALGAGALTIGGAAAALSPSLAGLAVGQLLMGFGLITSAVAGQAMIANRGPAERRVHRYGWYAVAVSIGQISGPAIGALLAPEGPVGAQAGPRGVEAETPAFVVVALAAGVGCLLTLALPHRRPRPVTAGPGKEPSLVRAAVDILRRPGIGAAVFVSLAVGSAQDVLLAFLPAWGAAQGMGVAAVGALLALRASASLVSRMFMGRLSDGIGIGPTLLVSAGAAAVGVGLLPLAGSVPLAAALMILIGLGLGVGQPMTVAWVAISSPAEERGLALGVRLTCSYAALLVVPTAIGIIAGAAGIDIIWIVLAMLLGVATIVAARTPFAAIDREARKRQEAPAAALSSPEPGP